MKTDRIAACCLLAVIFISALMFRLAYTESTVIPKNGIGTFGDTYLYHKIAYNVYKGHGFSGIDDGSAFGYPPAVKKPIDYKPEIVRGPVYPLFMSLVYDFAIHPGKMNSPKAWYPVFTDVRIVQCFLDAFIVLLIFFMVRMIYPASRVPAIIASILYAFDFYNIYYTRVLLTESITTFLIALALFFIVVGMKKRKWSAWGLSGICLGLTSLCRPEYLLLPLFFLLSLLFLTGVDRKKRVGFGAGLLLGVVVALSPWVIRNAFVFHRFIPTSVGSMGFNLYFGTVETYHSYGYLKELPPWIFANPKEEAAVYRNRAALGRHLRDGTIGISKYDDFFLELAISKMLQNPLKCLHNWIVRLPRLWYQENEHIYYYVEPSGIWALLYLALFFPAIFLVDPSVRKLMVPAYLLFLYVNLVYLPFHIEPRYCVPSLPGVISMAGIGAWMVIRLIRKTIPGRSGAADGSPG